MFTGAVCRYANFKRADLRGADLAGVKEWLTIADMSQANIHGVINPPTGFLNRAIKLGAVSIASTQAWRQELGEPAWPQNWGVKKVRRIMGLGRQRILSD